jgi:hypothetical protein
MRAVIEFARGVSSVMTPLECAKQFMAASAWLAATVVGRHGAIALLRRLATALERGEQTGAAN